MPFFALFPSMPCAYLYVNNFFPASLAWDLRSLHRSPRGPFCDMGRSPAPAGKLRTRRTAGMGGAGRGGQGMTKSALVAGGPLWGRTNDEGRNPREGTGTASRGAAVAWRSGFGFRD
ncbi:hypothetical protein ES708_10785 [subsurface metagenome]